MKGEPLDCAQIRSGFVAGRVPAGPEVDDHLRGCPHCRELFEKGAQLGRSLAGAVSPQVELGDLLAAVEHDVLQEKGLRATLRALPNGVRAGLLIAVTLGLLAFGLITLGHREDFARFSPGVFWGVLALLFGAFVVGARRITRGLTVPAGPESRQRGMALLYLLLPAAALLFMPLGVAPDEAEGWGSPSLCFVYGAIMVAPLSLLYWLFERRDRVPVLTLVSAGALSGIAANLLLCAHCSSAHLGHLLVGHATIGAAWAVVLSLLSWPRRAAS